MPWLWLAVAGVFEVAWVVLLKRSDGFTQLLSSAAMAMTVAASFWCMS